MIETSQTYKDLLALGDAVEKETRVKIGETYYTREKIVSLQISHALLSGDKLIGNCGAATLFLELRKPGTIPRMAKIEVEGRLARGGATSEWIPMGTYYIDTRKHDAETAVLSITAYDSMLMTEQPFTTSGDQGQWPMTDINVVRECAQRIGATLDAETENIIDRGYAVQYPGFGEGAYTMREVLGFIGVMYGGNWTITPDNQLRLVKMGYQYLRFMTHEPYEFITADGLKFMASILGGNTNGT